MYNSKALHYLYMCGSCTSIEICDLIIFLNKSKTLIPSFFTDLKELKLLIRISFLVATTEFNCKKKQQKYQPTTEFTDSGNFWNPNPNY